MISTWIAKQGQGDHVVKTYLMFRRNLTHDMMDGDPDWGLMLDQLLKYYYKEGNMAPVLVRVNRDILSLKRRGE